MNRTTTQVTIYVATMLGVFALPYYVPRFSDTFSISAVFHFNNQAAIVALAAGFAAAILWHWRFSSENPSPAGDNGPLPLWPLLVTFGATAVWMILDWLAAILGTTSNAPYFLYKLFCLQAGLRPYRDFEFAYGPGMLYIPDAVIRVTGLSVVDGYLLALWVFVWFGLLMLWWVVREARAGTRDKIAVFLVAAAFPALNPEYGIEYNLTRYVAGLAALVAARFFADKLSEHWLETGFCHVILTLATFSISPEIGLAFLASLMAYWLQEFLAGERWIARAAAVHMGLLAGCVLVAPRGTFLSVGGFGAGQNNLPLFPSPYNLIYVGSLMLAVAPMLAASARDRVTSRARTGVFGNLTAPIAVQAAAMIPAVFGRADGGHVFYNGTAVFLLALFYPMDSTAATAAKSRWFPRRAIYSTALLVTSLVLGIGLDRVALLPSLGNLAALRLTAWSVDHPGSFLGDIVPGAFGPDAWKRHERDLAYFRAIDLENRIKDLRPYGKICEPIGHPEIFIRLGEHGLLQPEYYYALSEESPRSAMQRKEKDAGACEYAILPGMIATEVLPAGKYDIPALEKILMFPIGVDPVFRPPDRAYLKYLHEHFVPIERLTPDEYLCRRVR